MVAPLMVTLEPSSSYNNRDILIKRLPREYLSNTFRNVVQKLLSSEADEYNPPYNADERYIAERIQMWFYEMNVKRSGVVRVAAISNDGPICVSLDDKVSDYTRRILKDWSRLGEEGKRERWHLIDLCISVDEGPCG